MGVRVLGVRVLGINRPGINSRVLIRSGIIPGIIFTAKLPKANLGKQLLETTLTKLGNPQGKLHWGGTF